MAVKGSVLCVLTMVFAGPVFSAGKVVHDVSADKRVMGQNETVKISFRLTENARVTVLVHTPDYQVVGHLLENIDRPAGVNTVFWDGTDDSGVPVPDEAYLFTVSATDKNGNETVYDPTAYSGGEIVDIRLDGMTPSGKGYEISYSTTVPARVNIRAGIHKGPLLNTLLNWVPKDAGVHKLVWDGLDATGAIKVMDQPESHVFITGFRLPDNAVILERGISGYESYQAGIKENSAKGLPGAISAGNVRSGSLKRMNQGVSSYYLIPRSQNVVPKFSVRGKGKGGGRMTGVENASSPVSGNFPLIIEVDPESLENFNNSRYEIVMFVDNERTDEEEYALSPYTYILDTTKLPNGEHRICINMAGLAGQVGSYSFTINVQN